MVILTNLIFISSEENKNQINKFIEELESSKFYNINFYNLIEESINKIKTIRFEETIIIISGNLYIKFIELFQKNIKDIYIIPKIIIYTDNKEDFINKNIQYKKIINHPFYNSGGIKTDFEEINKFILNPICKKKILLNKDDDKQLVFEYINSKEKLLLPMFYKTLMEITPNDKIEKFTESLCKKYYNKSEELDILLNTLKSVSNIPIELLSKYYTRIYTDNDSRFYSDLNKGLRENKVNEYISYIKVLYEGIRLQALPLSSDKILYRGTLLSNQEIGNIKQYLNKKIEGLPGAIIFSKAFLSFSKSKDIALYFLNMDENKNKELSKVLFTLEKDENIDYSLSTHSDIEKLSYFEEKEVLFFPFSSFEIKDIQEINDKNEKIYEIKLLYLGKYIKEFKKDKTFIEKSHIIPNTEFKKEIIKAGLIKPENFNIKNNTKDLIKKYDEYKEKIIKNKTENQNNNIEQILKKIEKDENIKNDNEIKKQSPTINQLKNNNTDNDINNNSNNNVINFNKKMANLINIFENKNDNNNKKDNKLNEKKDNKIIEKKDNKLIEKKDNKLIEKKDNKIIEKKDNKILEKKDNKILEKKDSKLLE